MYQLLNVASFAPLAVLSISACEAPQKDVGGAKAGQQSSVDRQIVPNKQGPTVTNQHVPINQQFRSLDEYLTYLEQMQGPVDGPWYKEIGPGIYELQTGNLRVLTPDEGKRTFTREELERQFGFSK